MKTSDIFGISKTVHMESYIDRKSLDTRFKRLLNRDKHIALKGASKSGKSWLRQHCLADANVVQCRLGETRDEIFTEALGNLGISIESSYEDETLFKGSINGQAELGAKILAKVSADAGIEIEKSKTTSKQNLWFRLENLKFISDVIISSEKRLVIEDFHYLSLEERKKFAFDLKTLWDYGCFVIIIGVWTQTNLLTSMNSDLSGRIEELSILWSENDLRNVIIKGSQNLNIEIDDTIIRKLISDSYSNVGILQSLLLYPIEDVADIEESTSNKQFILELEQYSIAAQLYAKQLDGLYQQFAATLSRGIKKRKKSTGIYALAMQAIVESNDDKMIDGLPRDEIYEIAHKKEQRVQKGNLKTVLAKLEDLQIDEANRNLVIAYDESTDAVFIVDRQLLFYRKHHTMKWPWEEMFEEAVQGSLFEEDCEL